MGILHGSVSYKRLLALGPVPSLGDILAGLQAEAFRPFEDGSEEERVGFCDWRRPLNPPDPNWVEQERFWVFGLRVDTRRIPAAVLKAQVDQRLQALMQEKDLAFIGKEARISIQDEVKAELLPKVMPNMKVFEMVWDRKEAVVCTTATSSKLAGLVSTLFMKCWGIEVQALGPFVLAGMVAPFIPTENLMALDPFDLEVSNDSGE